MAPSSSDPASIGREQMEHLRRLMSTFIVKEVQEWVIQYSIPKCFFAKVPSVGKVALYCNNVSILFMFYKCAWGCANLFILLRQGSIMVPDLRPLCPEVTFWLTLLSRDSTDGVDNPSRLGESLRSRGGPNRHWQRANVPSRVAAERTPLKDVRPEWK
ncbi:uncharacterized protein A4U43_C01F23650 [Asparagus officinalis]|uniref:Uncharacterized protein n=1 Tax=Asparagus officinalis TaxID=4686 RepID=A0A5P1FTF4_ASPOF|nr:uncharacterized protein A4U43_C01F23650 [Asparagus officinalis]